MIMSDATDEYNSIYPENIYTYILQIYSLLDQFLDLLNSVDFLEQDMSAAASYII